MDAQEVLFREGVKLGMCAKFKDTWGTPNTKELVNKFFAGMDFCIEHDFPKVDTIKELFAGEDIQSLGVYVEDGISEEQPSVVVLGDAVVNIYIPAYKTCDIYVRHNSHIHLHMGAGAFAYVSIFNDANVHVDDKDATARIFCSRFGGTIHDKEMIDTIHNKVKED